MTKVYFFRLSSLVFRPLFFFVTRSSDSRAILALGDFSRFNNGHGRMNRTDGEWFVRSIRLCPLLSSYKGKRRNRKS